jgi:hypothetical protein
MRKRTIRILNNKYIIYYLIKINKGKKNILGKENYMIKYFISY